MFLDRAYSTFVQCFARSYAYDHLPYVKFMLKNNDNHGSGECLHSCFSMEIFDFLIIIFDKK